MTGLLVTHETTVTLRGKDVGRHAVTWSGAIVNDLPDRAAGGDAVPQRTGTIFWRSDSLIDQNLSPLDEGYPQPGDAVTVTAWVRQGRRTLYRGTVFTGVIDETTGGMGEPIVSSIIDRSDDLNAAVSYDPAAWYEPRPIRTTWRGIVPGTYTAHIFGEVARACGFGAGYPRFRGRKFLHVTLDGSFHTNWIHGNLQLASAAREETGQPWFATTSSAQRGLRLGNATWMVRPSAPNFVFSTDGYFIDAQILDATAKTDVEIGVRFTRTGVDRVMIRDGGLWVGGRDGEANRVADIPDGDHVFGIYVPVTGNLAVHLDGRIIPTNTGRHTGGDTIYRPDAEVTMDTVSNRPVYVMKRTTDGLLRDVFIGGFYPTYRGRDTWTQVVKARENNNTQMRLGDSPTVQYIPGVEAETGKNVLVDPCQAFCVASWIDGAGALQFASGKVLRSRPALVTLTEQDYEPVTWSSSLTHRASRVVVKGKTSEINLIQTGNCVQEVWSGSGNDVMTETSIDWIVKIPDGEDFFEIDMTPVNLNESYWAYQGGDLAQRREVHWYGWYSVFAAAKSDVGVDPEKPADHVPYGRIACTVTRIGTKTYKVTMRKHSEMTDLIRPQISRQAEKGMRLNVERTGMPVLRAGGHIVQVDADPIYKATGGPKGPDLIHDMGPFFGDGAAEAMRDELAEYFATAHPVFDDVRTTFNPRIDVGIVVDVDASARWGHVFRCLVVKVTHDAAAGTTEFTPRVISLRRTQTTYRDVAEIFADYRDMDARGSYSQVTGASEQTDFA